ncbi:MAG: Maf family protein [Candidatus Heteroscillospira sp.]|jgi:septum formation protein
MRIILASGSPRRRELLEMLGVKNLTIHPAVGEEIIPPGAGPEQTVMALAAGKCSEVAALYGPEDLIIAADTVVAAEGKILGKPRTREEAVSMLGSLSGREHRVFTGLAVKCRGQSVCEYEETAVRFRQMTGREISAYADSGECMDKAGAYGIQGKGGYFVSGITGDYYNVMGLPLCRLGVILGRLGVDLI